MSSDAKDAHASTPAVPPEAVGTLKKLKETEALWQKRLEDARSRGETKVKYAQAARDRAIADARRAAEELRTRLVQDARAQAETESRRIMEEVKAEVARTGTLSGSEIDARFDETLSAVFGELRSSGAKATGTPARPASTTKSPPAVAAR